jgi:hypothetical protein
MADKKSEQKESGPKPAPGSEAAGQSSTSGISKMEAVRRALAELGKGAGPTAIQVFVKDRFGLEMTKDHISVCKAGIRKQSGKPRRPPGRQRGSRARSTRQREESQPSRVEATRQAPVKKRKKRRKARTKPAAPVQPTAAASPPVAAKRTASKTILLQDVQAIKALVARVGANHLLAVIDLLEK